MTPKGQVNIHLKMVDSLKGFGKIARLWVVAFKLRLYRWFAQKKHEICLRIQGKPCRTFPG